MGHFRWCMGLPVLAIWGCSDLGTSPVLSPPPITQPQTSESEYDPPTEWPVRIRSTHANVVMGDENSPTYIDATMRYDAYHASIGATGTLRDPSGSSTFNFGPVEKHSFWAFLDNHHGVQWKLTTPHNCGSMVDVNVSYLAWWRGIGADGEARYDSQPATRPAHGAQTECANGNESGENDNDGESGPGGDGTPGGGPGDTKYCWWQYTFDAESGEITDFWLVMCWYM